MNNYLKDSGIFFKQVSKGIENAISDDDVIQLTFNLALGCERLLKGILYDINPTYILIEPGFKHSLLTLYQHRIIPDVSVPNRDLATNPNADVITFSNSLLRAQLVSSSVYNHKNILFVISHARDIIAHCELKLFDSDKMREILQRDFYIMMKSFAAELNIKQSHFFNQSHIKLSRISRSLQTDLTKQLELLLEEHKSVWNNLKNTPGFVEEKVEITKEILSTQNKELIECPACSNDAVVYLKPIVEIELLRLEEEIIGYQVKKIKCQYCKLEITDPAILDKLGITDREIHTNPNCEYCGEVITSGNICTTCARH